MKNMKAINDLKRELVRYGEKIYEASLVIGSGGNISARLGDVIYHKSRGISLKESMGCDYNEVSLEPAKTINQSSKPSSIELPMHLACYKARPDIGAVIHTHPIYGTVIAGMGAKVGMISYEFMVSMGSEVPSIKFFTPGSAKLAEAVRKMIRSHNGVLLKNHGALVVGKDLKEAFFRAMALERACKILLLSKLAGKVSLIPQQ
jgi:L-fuculose-phosphate aldolase